MKPDIQRVLGAVPQPSAPVAAASAEAATCGGRQLDQIRGRRRRSYCGVAAVSHFRRSRLVADVVVYAAGQPNDVRWGRCVGLSERSLTVALAAGLWTAYVRPDRQRRRRIPDGAVGGDGPRYPGRLPGRWAARRRPARRLQRGTGCQQLGDGGQRDEHARRLGHLGGRTGRVARGASTPTGNRTAAGSGRRSWPTNCPTIWRPTRAWRRAATASSAPRRAAPAR